MGKCAFTLAEVFSPHSKGQRKVAFTLAEVLITLGIIGVVAAITMPTLIQNHKKSETISKLKKVYSSLSQMLLLSNADNGPANEFLSEGTIVDEETTKEFFDKYWRPYFKGVQVFTNSPYANNNPYIQSNGIKYGITVHTNYRYARILFSTADGTIFFLRFMDWEHVGAEDGDGAALYSSLLMILVDINGTKGPNQFGKDIFRLQIDYDKNIIQPTGIDRIDSVINTNCSKTGDGLYCLAKIIHDGWQIKDDYPW